MAPVIVKPGMAAPHGNVAGDAGELVSVAVICCCVEQVRLYAALFEVAVTGLVTMMEADPVSLSPDGVKVYGLTGCVPAAENVSCCVGPLVPLLSAQW